MLRVDSQIRMSVFMLILIIPLFSFGNNEEKKYINSHRQTNEGLIGNEFSNKMPYSPNTPLPFVDSVELRKRIFFISSEARYGGVFRTDGFLNGDNMMGRPVRETGSFHLKGGFRTAPGSWIDRVFDTPYQGIGFMINKFNNKRELGAPWGVYLFQGARISQLSGHFSLWYEWNFGLSSGWRYFNASYNPYNQTLGSKVNAYMNANLFVTYDLSTLLDISLGVSLTHFSNGNSHEPNRGLNSITGKLALTYYLTNDEDRSACFFGVGIEPYKRRMMYELSFYGATIRKELIVQSHPVISYGTEAFNVWGGSFAPLYSFNHRFRLGGSLDFIYDESRNIEYYLLDGEFRYNKPKLKEQLSLGTAFRADFVMPYFTISGTLGYDVLVSRQASKRFYQTLALKVDVFKGSFINIGYRLRNFQTSDFLMLGVGYLFNGDKLKYQK